MFSSRTLLNIPMTDIPLRYLIEKIHIFAFCYQIENFPDNVENYEFISG